MEREQSSKNEAENEVGKRGFAARTHSVQAIAGGGKVGRQAKATKIKGSKIQGVMKGVYIRVQRLFTDLFSPEIALLCGVVVYLQTVGKMTAKRDDVVRWLGYRAKPATRKALRRLESLADKGYLLRVLNKSGSIDRRGYGYALSERGHQVILCLDREYDKAAEWVARVERLDDVVLYLDKAHQVLRKNQEIVMTPELTERLRGIDI